MATQQRLDVGEPTGGHHCCGAHQPLRRPCVACEYRGAADAATDWFHCQWLPVQGARRLARHWPLVCAGALAAPVVGDPGGRKRDQRCQASCPHTVR